MPAEGGHSGWGQPPSYKGRKPMGKSFQEAILQEERCKKTWQAAWGGLDFGGGTSRQDNRDKKNPGTYFTSTFPIVSSAIIGQTTYKTRNQKKAKRESWAERHAGNSETRRSLDHGWTSEAGVAVARGEIAKPPRDAISRLGHGKTTDMSRPSQSYATDTRTAIPTALASPRARQRVSTPQTTAARTRVGDVNTAMTTVSRQDVTTPRSTRTSAPSIAGYDDSDALITTVTLSSVLGGHASAKGRRTEPHTPSRTRATTASSARGAASSPASSRPGSRQPSNSGVTVVPPRDPRVAYVSSIWAATGCGLSSAVPDLPRSDRKVQRIQDSYTGWSMDGSETTYERAQTQILQGPPTHRRLASGFNLYQSY
eukprot:m.108570 g.108570  ORF g.108570 m.108570 type:complete len:369 (+) comp10661_c0_seq2:47-1153(+)